MQLLRAFMLVAAASLAVGATIHAGTFGNPFYAAAIYEASIAVLLVVGVALTLGDSATARVATLATQGIVLAGSLVGLFLAIRGITPGATSDIVYHAALITLLLGGLIVAWRLPSTPARPRETVRLI